MAIPAPFSTPDPFPGNDVDTPNPYYNIEAPVITTQGHLKHRSQSGKLIFITFRLAGSLPQDIIRQKLSELETWKIFHPNQSEEEAKEKIMRNAISYWERYLDDRDDQALLKDGRFREIVANILHEGDGKYYTLIQYVVMPNHVHLLLITDKDFTIQQILHNIKRYSARKINILRNTPGVTIWEREYFDRIIRSEKHLSYVVRYIAQNPSRLSHKHFSYWKKDI